MHHGRIEQVDVPGAVFHLPANRFVATFMGDADFLPGRRDGADFHTEAGPVAAPAGLPSGQRGEVMLRPHEVSLHPHGAGAGGGRVVAAEFQGGFYLYTVELPSGRRLRSLQPHTTTWPVGSTVAVELTPGHVPAVLVGDRAVEG
ncbi:MAG TPA: TOBE domain-containing protein, partial [Nocardioidaceae bacterium]|nr:TOBE domain-containing protein [Nocardioidaceae bacterium]